MTAYQQLCLMTSSTSSFPGMVASLSIGVDRASIDCCRDAVGVPEESPIKVGVALIVIHSGVASYRKS